MDGREVYRFPDGACHFFSDGSSIFFALDNFIVYFDPQANEVWRSKELWHHDFDVTPDEKEIAVITQDRKPYKNKVIVNEAIRILNREGKETFSWFAEDHIAEFDPKTKQVPFHEFDNIAGHFHLNSVQILRPNALEDAIPAFKRGNIFVNCFQNSKAFIIDRQSGKIIWRKTFETEAIRAAGPYMEQGHAHTVKMLDNGHWVLMINDHNFELGQQAFTAVEEYDPLSDKTVWRYVSDPVFTFTTLVWGSAYRLAGGNTLITFSVAGSAFEVTPDGRVVWEWVNPETLPTGLPGPIYRVTRVPRVRLDPIIAQWKKVFGH
jgi:hypothetical protein